MTTADRGNGTGSGDYLVRAVAAGGQVRVLAARTTNLVEDARQRHNAWPTATAALGRALTATAILAADLEDDGALTLRITGGGPLGAVVCSGRSGGSVRGYVDRPHVDLPLNPLGKLDVGRAVGRSGFFQVTRDTGRGEPYTGSIRLVSGEIGEDLTRYLVVSEQVPSVGALGVLVGQEGVEGAGGLVLQLLPGAEEGLAERIEGNAAQLGSISRLVAGGATPEDLVEQVLEGFSPRALDRTELAFLCSCSRERVAGMLLALGEEELADMASEGQAEVRCHFCNTAYQFTGQELWELRKRARWGG